MANRRILLADNDADFLTTCAEHLESAGYAVVRASSLDEARQLVRTEWVHLAILDVRLQRDDDEKDRSGLSLAAELGPSVPKIILTRFPQHQDVRQALLPVPGGLPLALDFVDKRDGMEALLAAVQTAFARYVRINTDLVFQSVPPSPITLAHILNLIETTDRNDTGPALLEEFEDLFRRLFYEEDQLRFDRVLWRSTAAIGLAVSAFSAGAPHHSYLVTCGKSITVARELERFREFAPKTTSHTTTVLDRWGQTTNFAANSYVLGDADISHLDPLRHIYNTKQEKLFNTAIVDTFTRVAVEWHHGKSILNNESLQEAYRRGLGIHSLGFSLKERIREVLALLKTIGVNAAVQAGQFELEAGRLSFSYPDPLANLDNAQLVCQPAVLRISPGALSGDNILVDETGKTWLTDFADAGLAPVLWNYTQLEAEIRFDWVECNRIQWLHEMEQCLVQGEFSKFSIGDVEQPLRKPLRAIQTIRRLASELVGNDPLPYHLGIFYHAIKRLADYDPKFHLTPSEVARLGHVLIAAAMIAGLLENERTSTDESPVEVGIRIDEPNRRVWVNGRRVSLSRQSYELLLTLYQRPNQLFTRKELGVRIFGDKYDDSDKNPYRSSDINRLNTAIFRLRKEIEDDPKHPRFLITEQTGGYRLAMPG